MVPAAGLDAVSNGMDQALWPLVVGIVLAAMLVAIGGLLQRWWGRRSDRLTRVRRARAAQLAERDARGLLRAAGYRVEAEQVRRCWRYEQDGVPVEAELRADFLVTREGIRYVADAKTGRDASLKRISTRRQLLEYQLAFRVPAVLLVDMEAERIHVVRFAAEALESLAVG